ncbi:MAG: hypothetical protein DRI97_00085 [Bacteroidetes bacterium]|nr:MAG: hypothetical protein DRI83_02430 [Bacteroidota bacterium]RLD59832.1 MAG: hypothetical protein DRI97_00085 [Bacteroidota bacterium]
MTNHPDAERIGLSLTPEQELAIHQSHIKVEGINYLTIPSQYLWAEDLNINEKFLMSFIRMADQKDHCWASNTTLAKWTGLTLGSLKNLIVALKKKGYLEQISWDGRHKRVIKCLK